MHCLLVLAMLSFSRATEALYNVDNVDKAVEKDSFEEKEMMPEKDLVWKKETKKWEKDLKEEKKDLMWKQRRSEPPPYMFHLLKQFAKEGRRGYARSLLPIKGGSSNFYLCV